MEPLAQFITDTNRATPMKTKALLSVVLLVFLCTDASLLTTQRRTVKKPPQPVQLPVRRAQPESRDADDEPRTKAIEKRGRVPLSFQAIQGQLAAASPSGSGPHRRMQFSSRGRGYDLFVSKPKLTVSGEGSQLTLNSSLVNVEQRS